MKNDISGLKTQMMIRLEDVPDLKFNDLNFFLAWCEEDAEKLKKIMNSTNEEIIRIRG